MRLPDDIQARLDEQAKLKAELETAELQEATRLKQTAGLIPGNRKHRRTLKAKARRGFRDD